MNYNKIILCVTLVFICLVMIHYHSKIQLDSKITIHQIEQILQDNIDSLKKTNMPIVIKFKKIMYHINLARLKTEQSSNLIFSEKLNKIKLSPEILPSINVIDRFKNTLNVQSNYSLSLLSEDNQTSYLKSNVSENIFIVQQGKVIVRLFHPNNQRFFNFVKTNSSSSL